MANAKRREISFSIYHLPEKVGYDAWHQFAVVNPMRYLGLIDDTKGKVGPWEIKVDLMERYGEILRSKLEIKNWRQEANIPTLKRTEIPKKIKDTIELFKKNNTIDDSHNIKTQHQLLILSE